MIKIRLDALTFSYPSRLVLSNVSCEIQDRMIYPTFWLGVLGFLKSLVWPVFLVLEAFKTLGL